MKFILKILFFISIILGDLKAQEWQDYSMPDDTTVFHKMCSVGDLYWAIDYGYGRVFKSENKGKDWQLNLETQGNYLEAIQFVDENTGYLCGDYGIIMKTVDGGKTWKEIGPSYAPQITKTNSMEEDSTAIGRYYYLLFFKDKDNGLVWGFEVKPLLGWRETSKRFFYKTADGGSNWERIEYDRGEYDEVVNAFLDGVSLNDEAALRIYHSNKKLYKASSSEVEISKDNGQSWQAYPCPQLPDERCMMRTINFINDHQGYMFGGSLNEPSTGYILETLDAGKTWRILDTDLPHIHYTLQEGKEIVLCGKSSLLKKWTPSEKADSSFIHKGSASTILIDGQIGRGEWAGANKTMLKDGIDLYTLQDDHYLYLSVQYDTARFKNHYCDLYFELGADTLLNIHASQQLGERVLTDATWTDSEPAFNWGYISDWTANQIKFDRANKVYIPYTALEFQISKNKLPKDKLKIALQSRDMNGKKELVNMPKEGDFKSTKDWLLLYF